MNIDDLTIGEARKLAALFCQQQQQTGGNFAHPAIGKYCVVRTYSAGVHAGVVIAANGKEVTLSDSRRIWSWTGALSCSEIASLGITGGKVAVPVLIHLTEAIEIIPASEKAETCLRKFA